MEGQTVTPIVYSNLAVQEAAGKMLLTLINAKFPDLLDDWANLKPVEKWNVFTKILPFIIPKQSSVTLNDHRASAQALVDQLISHAQETEMGVLDRNEEQILIHPSKSSDLEELPIIDKKNK